MADLAEGYEWETDLGNASPLGIPSHRWVRREATGVVGAITPWNVPHQINLAKLGPALAAGNTVVLKPAPDTPWCATVLGRLIAEETDIPPGVVNIVPSSDHAHRRPALAVDPRVDQVSFTGSTATGQAGDGLGVRIAEEGLPRARRQVGVRRSSTTPTCAARAPRRPSPCAPTPARAVPSPPGWSCPGRQFDEAVESTAKVLAKLPAGDPTDPGTICGPLISARQRERVEGYMRLAAEEGGTDGDRRRPARRLRPRLLHRAHADRRAWTTGPGWPRRRSSDRCWWSSPTTATTTRWPWPTTSSYGLSGSVWSADRERAIGVADRIRTGTIGINGGLWFSPDMPFGGYKQSGVGRESGVAGFEEYLETKSIAEPA